MVFDKLASVRSSIAAAAHRAGRAPGSVELMAVLKYAPPDEVRALLESKQVRHAGDNRVQDAERRESRFENRESNIQYHLIGHLQSNKAKKAVQLFDWIDSVDSMELAERLEREAAALGKTLNVLVQVQTAPNPGQSGAQPEQLGGLLERMRRLPHLKVSGLMAIAPMTDPVEAVRPHFRRMKVLLDEHFAGGEAPVLSMGMSRDYEVAVEEGATLVRIGSLLFGETPRQPS